MMHHNEFDERLQTVRARFEEWKVDGLLIMGDANRRWLTGFTGSAGKLLVTPQKAILATDFRYWEQATAQAPHFTLFKDQRRDEELAALVGEAEVGRIGFEAGFVTVAEYNRLK